jgi:hypothetical protein
VDDCAGVSSADTSHYDPHRRRRVERPAPNNPGAGLLLIALVVVLAVGLLVGPAALGQVREHATCVSSSTHQSGTCR